MFREDRATRADTNDSKQTSQCTAAVECSSPATFGGSTVASNTFDCDSFIGGDFKEIGDAPPVCQTEEARDYTFGNGGTCANAGDNLQMVLRDGNTWNLYAAPVGSGDVDQGLLIGMWLIPTVV